MNRLYKSYLLIFILFLISLLFLSKAFYNAVFLEIHSSKDLLIIYNLSKLFADKIDIYNLYFENKSINAPMWGQLCYIIFAPFSLLPFEIVKILWFFLNLLFLFFIIKILKKEYNLSFNQSLFLSIIVISSTPLTNTLGNGQLGLIFLLIALIYWYSKNKFKVLILSLFSTKISFGAIFILNSIIKKEIDFFILLLVVFISTIFYCFYVNNFSYQQFINPIFAILDFSKRYEFEGVGNLNDILNIFGVKNYYFIILSLSMMASSVLFYKKKKVTIYFFL